jgi:hypothetical protein
MNKKELELERNALLLDMAGKVDVIFQILTQASIQQAEPVKEKKSERKTSKKTKKD